MFKKLLVFALAFCLGLISWQINKQFKKDSAANSPQSNLFQPSEPNIEEPPKAVFPNDVDIKNFYLKFQKAVAENDRKTVASLINYPLRVNFPTDSPEKKYRFVNNQKSFLKVYDKIFNKNLKNFIAQVNADNEKHFIDRWDGVGVGRGVIWLEIFCYKRFCEDNRRYFKVRTIHGNSNLMDLD